MNRQLTYLAFINNLQVKHLNKQYNKTLSQNRANAAVDYVVSQGIERNRISGMGYGETQLLNSCADGVTCSEAMHQINRRTEMKVICPE